MVWPLWIIYGYGLWTAANFINSLGTANGVVGLIGSAAVGLFTGMLGWYEGSAISAASFMSGYEASNVLLKNSTGNVEVICDRTVGMEGMGIISYIFKDASTGVVLGAVTLLY